jgi:hypothetical protein
MNIDSLIDLAKQANTQIPAILSLLSWWKYFASILVIIVIIETICIIYLYFWDYKAQSKIPPKTST